MGRAMTFAVLAGACAIGLPAAVLGDDTATAQHDAQARFNEGLLRVQSGNFEGARTSFTQAYAVLHKPDILWNLALAEEKCGMALSATQHFKEYMRQVTAAGERAAASKHVQDLAAQMGHIDVVAPAGAVLVVDGVSVGDAPLSEPVDVEPGRHHVIARSGGIAKSAYADAIAGQVVHVSFVLVEPDAPPAAEASRPAAAPAPAPTSVAPRAEGPSSPATVSSGGFWTPRVVVTGSLWVAAVAAGVAGFVLGQKSSSKFNQAQSLRANPGCLTGCPQLGDAVNVQHQDFVASEVLWTVGGVLLAGAAVTWFVWPRGTSNAVGGSELRVAPSVGVDGAGAVVSGTF